MRGIFPALCFKDTAVWMPRVQKVHICVDLLHYLYVFIALLQSSSKPLTNSCCCSGCWLYLATRFHQESRRMQKMECGTGASCPCSCHPQVTTWNWAAREPICSAVPGGESGTGGLSAPSVQVATWQNCLHERFCTAEAQTKHRVFFIKKVKNKNETKC